MKESSSAEITTREAGAFTVATVEGEINLYSVSQLRKDINRLIDSGVKNLAIDMRNVKYMDSSGIALMANLQKKIKSIAGKFVILQMHEDILNVLKLAALDKFFVILPTEEELASQ